jgi:hypothetical protein
MGRRARFYRIVDAASVTEIAAAHPQATRFEIWSQDKVRAGQQERTGYIWWHRGETPRGWRDAGYESAWIIGPCARHATPAWRWCCPGSTPP